jgi:hypothetical protein
MSFGMNHLFFLVFLSLASTAQAQDSCSLVPALRTQLELAYYNKNSIPDYIPGLCPSNIHKVTEHLAENNIPLERAEVLYLYRRTANDKLDQIWPQSSRAWDGKPWTLHVVLNFDGMILDLDYAAPKLEKIQTYFAKMFGNGTGANSELLVKRISAIDFLPQYWLHYARNPKSFLDHETDSLYPPQRLQDYLQAQPESPCQI